MTNPKNEPSGIPFIVHLRAYLPHAIIFLISAFAYTILFFLIGESSVKLSSEMRRINNAPYNEVVIAGMPNGNESFFYLKNYAVSGAKEKNALSDILMLLPDVDYKENSLGFCGGLEAGECAVSANVADRYGLDVGENAQIIGSEKTFKVSRILPAQNGIDSDYMHDGIVILSYDKDLLDRSYLYMSFATDSDGYLSLKTLIYLNDVKNKCAFMLLIYSLIAAFSLVSVAVLSEKFIFKRRLKDYRIFKDLGLTSKRAFLLLLLENVFKYVLSCVVICSLFSLRFGSYASAYYIPVLLLVEYSVFLSLTVSLIFIRRLYNARARA